MPSGQGQSPNPNPNPNTQQLLQAIAATSGLQYRVLLNLGQMFSNFFQVYQQTIKAQAQAMQDLTKVVAGLGQGGAGGQGPPGQVPPVVPGSDGMPLRNPARELGDAIQAMARTVPVLGNSIASLIGSFRQMTDSASKLGRSLPTIHRVDDPDARKKSSDLFKQIYDRNDTPGGTKVATTSEPSGLAGIAGAATAIAGVATAASAAVAALQGMANAAASVVQALAPGTVMAFNLAMRDLTATFGVALQPVVQAGTQFARMLGAVLLPVMENMRPVFQELGGVFLQVSQVAMTAFARLMAAMQPAIDAFSKLIVAMEPLFKAFVVIGEAAMSALMPLFTMMAGLFEILAVPLKLLGDALNAIAPLFEAFTVITRGLAEVFSTLFKSIMSALGIDTTKDAFASLRGVMQQLARAAILAAGALAKMMGFDTAVEAMMKALVPDRKDNTGLAVVQNPVVGGDFAGYQQAVARAALMAGGQGDKPQDEEKAWRESIKNDLKGLAATNWDEIAKTVGTEVGGFVYRALKEAAKNAGEGVLSAADAAAMDAMNSNIGRKAINLLPGAKAAAGWLGVPGYGG